MVHAIENADKFQDQLKSAGNNLVVVDFHATWCGPCKMIAPKIEELSKEMTNVIFLKVDVDDVEDVAAEYNISAMPTFIFIKNKKKVGEVVGASLDKIKAAIKEYS